MKLQNGVSVLSIVAAALAWTRPAPTTQQDLRELMSHVSFVDTPIDPFGHTVRTLRLSGLNLQVVNGTGDTFADLPGGAGDGLGNIIIGYNEDGDFYHSTERTGCHNLVLGYENNYGQQAYGGIVAGVDNETQGHWASILGGSQNVADAPGSVIVGGHGNQTAFPSYSSVIGGGENRSTVDFYDFAAGSILEDD